MRNNRSVIGVVLGLVALWGHGVATQSPQSPPQVTFRTTTSMVEVDVVIHDKKGDFVGGLTADDLQLFEDGKPQKIEQFYMVAHERGGQLFPVTGDQDVLPEDRARLFEPYVTTREKGTGLGLPIVKKIIEEHGGTLALEDAAPFAPGARPGAMAVIRLPLRAGPKATAQTQPDPRED